MFHKIAPAALAVLTALPVAAQEADAELGAALFERHCAVCHGADATGGGPLAPALIVQPPDLTGLAALDDGRFPMARVVRRIDGRDPLVAHGSPMPVYGGFFDGPEEALKAETGQPIIAAQEVAVLARYIRSLQR